MNYKQTAEDGHVDVLVWNSLLDDFYAWKPLLAAV